MSSSAQRRDKWEENAVLNRSFKDDIGNTLESSENLRGQSTSEWANAGKEARSFLKKQTEQAMDFAKGMTSEDAKKMASETAKKAKVKKF